MEIARINTINFKAQSSKESLTTFGKRVEMTKNGNAVYDDQDRKVQDITYEKEYIQVEDYDPSTGMPIRGRTISRIHKGLSFDYDYKKDMLTVVSMAWPNGNKMEVSKFKGSKPEMEHLQERTSYYENGQVKCLQKRVSPTMFERTGYDKNGKKVFSHYTEKLIFQ